MVHEDDDVRIRKIFIYAARPGASYPRGKWHQSHEDLKTARCYSDGEAVMHANDDVKFNVEADWLNSDDFHGDIEFRFVIQSFQKFYF